MMNKTLILLFLCASVSFSQTSIMGRAIDSTGAYLMQNPMLVLIGGKWVYKDGINMGTTVSVKSYGAKGDGSTDNLTAIQNAINAVSASGGGSVVIPPESSFYAISNSLSMKSKVSLVGYGEASHIRMTGNLKSVVTCDSITDFYISGLKLSATRTGVSPLYGVEIKHTSQRGVVQDCHIDSTFVGVIVGNIPPESASHDIWVLNNRITNTTLNPIGINGICRNVRVEGNYIDGFGTSATTANPAAGIEYRGGSYGTVSGNIIRNGMFGYPDSSNFIMGIRLEYLTEGSKQAPEHIKCDNNNIYAVNGDGIQSADASRYSSISGNVIDSVINNGLYIVTGNTAVLDFNTISGNVISRCGQNGIKVEGLNPYPVRDNIISGNVITHAHQNGIYMFYDTYYNEISGNVITGCGYRGIWQNASQHNTFANNTIRDCADSGNVPAFHSMASKFTTIIGLRTLDTRTPGQHTYGAYIAPTDTSDQLLNSVFSGSLYAKYLNEGSNTSIANSLDMTEGIVLDTIRSSGNGYVIKSTGTTNQQLILMAAPTKHNGFIAVDSSVALADTMGWGMFGGPNNYMSAANYRVALTLAKGVPGWGVQTSVANLNDPTGRIWPLWVARGGGVGIGTASSITVPDSTLSVAGSGKITGNLKVGGSVRATLPFYANKSAARSAGLTSGQMYMTVTAATDTIVAIIP